MFDLSNQESIFPEWLISHPKAESMTDFDKTAHTGQGQNTHTSAGHEYRPEQIVGGKYKVIRSLGQGGAGNVLLVEQLFLNTRYALKTLLPTDSATSLRRFQNEAKAASLLDHPNLVKLHDFGLLEDGQSYLVMEFVEGKTLHERIKANGRLEIEEALEIIIQVCMAIEYAHESGIIHRDIKPGNIILAAGEDGPVVKILDFGIAKLLQDQGEPQAITQTGEIFGSPVYMSPEQCVGQKVDHRTDIYSLGCVLYETLTGNPPHLGQSAPSTMMLHQTKKPMRLSERSPDRKFPDALEKIVDKMLQKDPADRYQNLGSVARDLAAVLSKLPNTNPKLAKELATLNKTAPSLSKTAQLREKKDAPEQTDKINMPEHVLYILLLLTVCICGGLAAALGYFFS